MLLLLALQLRRRLHVLLREDAANFNQLDRIKIKHTNQIGEVGTASPMTFTPTTRLAQQHRGQGGGTAAGALIFLNPLSYTTHTHMHHMPCSFKRLCRWRHAVTMASGHHKRTESPAPRQAQHRCGRNGILRLWFGSRTSYQSLSGPAMIHKIDRNFISPVSSSLSDGKNKPRSVCARGCKKTPSTPLRVTF